MPFALHNALALCAGLACLCVSAARCETLSRTFIFPEPTVSPTPDGHVSVALEGCEPDVQTGKPILPVTGATFEIPPGFEAAEVIQSPDRIREIPLSAPVQWGLPPRLPHEAPAPDIQPDPAVYGGADLYPDPSVPVWRTDPMEVGSRLSVPLFPVRFDPSGSRLLAAGTVTVTVTLRAVTPQPAAAEPQRTPFSTSPLGPAASHTYLVLAPTNLIHTTPPPWNLEALCAARARAGFTPAVVSVEWVYANYAGTNSAARIRAFVQDAHRQWGTRYLLLCGTFETLPVQKLYVSFVDFIVTRTAEIPADALYYGCMDGTYDGNGNGRYGEVTDGVGGGDVDLTAEVLVGRFPAASAEELSHLIRKTLRYESATAQELAPNALLAEKMDLGSTVYATGFMEELRWGTNTYALATLGFESSPYADVLDTGHTLYDSDAGLWSTSNALAFLNRDYQTVNHIGHGTAKLCAKISLAQAANQTALRSFTNSLPYFMYSQACDSGAFDTPDCFAEQLVTVSNAAFSTVMNARAGWEYNNAVGGYSHRFHRAFWDAALSGAATRLGEINEQSRRMNLHTLTPYSANYWRWVYYELNLFGDPATPFAAAINVVLPAITHAPLANTYDTQTAYRVACTVDPVGIYDPDAIRLVWQTSREPALVYTQALAQAEGNLFEGLIPPQPAKTRVAYAILAANHAGYSSRWPQTGDAVFYVTERLSLDVRGSPLDYGAVSPAYGTTFYPSGAVASATAPALVPLDDSTRFANRGFAGTGSAPQSGTNLTVSFQMDRSSLLLWLWQREHRLTLAANLPDIPTQTFWTAENVLAAVPPVPETETNNGAFAFAEWRLDGARTPAAPGYCPPSFGSLLMEAPHRLEAVYLPASLDADTNAVPDWWEFRYFGACGQDPGADHDGDGFTLAEEFADWSSPLSAAVIPSPPVITHTPLAETQTVPGPFAIRAAITDTRSVATAAVRWHRRAEAWQETPMTPLSNSVFEARIGPLSGPGDDFEYQILASDPSGRASASPVYFFFLQYPVADYSRLHDLSMVGLPTQAAVSAYMNLHNTGNADLVWTLRFDRVENILATNLPCWDMRSLGQSWEVSTNRTASAPYALHSRLISAYVPNTPVRATVTFPAVTPGPKAVFSFKYWINSEIHSTTTRAFDGGLIEYSLDNGATFQQLRGPYTHTIYGWAASPWPEGTPCFAGRGTEGWRTAVFDLAALYPELNGFSGVPVLFRFHYGADNNTDYEGWYVDDVTLAPLQWQAGFSHDIPPSYDFIIPAGGYRRILWSITPLSMLRRDDNLTVQLLTNDPLAPLHSFTWQAKVRDYPRLTGLAAAQTAAGDGRVNLRWGVSDADGEPVDLDVQWSPDNGRHWSPAALADIVATLGSAPTNSAGTVTGLPTDNHAVRITNLVSSAWLSRAVVPPIDVNTQTLFRVSADNGFYCTTGTTQRVIVDNVPPAFLPGPLACSPMSQTGPYAVTANLLSLSWPAATDTPFTNLTYRLISAAATNLVSAAAATLALSNRLDTVHVFRVVALDPAGNASAPLETSLLILDALGDFDGDGMTTADEETAGTSAAQASDRLAAGLSLSAGALRLAWPSVAGRLYTVEASPALAPPDWQPLPACADLPGTGAPLDISLPPDTPTRFFRIRVRLP